jgi:hypothetical protein
MNRRFTLDVPALQKLLEAAWVLQCQRDRELSAAWIFKCQHDRELSESRINDSQTGVTVLAVPSDKGELDAALPLTSPRSAFEPVLEPVFEPVFEPGRAVAEEPATQVREVISPSAVPSPLTVAPIYQPIEVAGALALDNRLRDVIPFPAPDVSEGAARGTNQTAAAGISRRVTLNLSWFGDKYRVGLRLVPFRDEYKGKEHALARRTTSVLKHASRVTTAYIAPAVVVMIMLAFAFSLRGSHRSTLSAVNAAPPVPVIVVDGSRTRDYVGRAQAAITAHGVSPQPSMPKPRTPESSVPEPSHQRVTDAAASSLVEGLSPYEMETVRQQAQYGDDVAALTLGMAYEIGRNVPQSCAQAAHWVAVAAGEGNSAAQYNLALRYVSGDGTPTDPDEARKWLQKAARRGYQKARLTLQGLHS